MATAVVTGAASGIGRALASRLAGDGYTVHLADVASTGELADSIGGVPHAVDVSSRDQMLELSVRAADADVVCLNAGIVGTAMGAPWEVEPDEWRHLLDVNLLGVVNGLYAFVPKLVASRRRCRIVITASLAGLVTFPAGGAYAGTKHAVVAVAEQAALALADTDVSVTLLCPALVRTGMSDVGQDPADVATAALAAADAGTFLVVPPEWTSAVRLRTEHLLLGRVPQVPTPTVETQRST